MPAFLIVMIIGMVGLLLMAIPGLNHHGHGIHAGSHGSLHHIGHASTHAGTHAPSHGSAARLSSSQTSNQAEAPPTGVTGLLRWIPSPRTVFSLMSLYGAFGLALTEGAHLQKTIAALLAIIPAALIEKYVVTPIWNSLMQFEGVPSSPLEELTLQEAEAVTPFRNGKGMVTVVRDGRAVQLRATLPDDQCAMPVRVGDKLRIEQVDAEHERVTVTFNA